MQISHVFFLTFFSVFSCALGYPDQTPPEGNNVADTTGLKDVVEYTFPADYLLFSYRLSANVKRLSGYWRSKETMKHIRKELYLMQSNNFATETLAKIVSEFAQIFRNEKAQSTILIVFQTTSQILRKLTLRNFTYLFDYYKSLKKKPACLEALGKFVQQSVNILRDPLGRKLLLTLLNMQIKQVSKDQSAVPLEDIKQGDRPVDAGEKSLMKTGVDEGDVAGLPVTKEIINSAHEEEKQAQTTIEVNKNSDSDIEYYTASDGTEISDSDSHATIPVSGFDESLENTINEELDEDKIGQQETSSPTDSERKLKDVTSDDDEHPTGLILPQELTKESTTHSEIVPSEEGTKSLTTDLEDTHLDGRKGKSDTDSGVSTMTNDLGEELDGVVKSTDDEQMGTSLASSLETQGYEPENSDISGHASTITLSTEIVSEDTTDSKITPSERGESKKETSKKTLPSDSADVLEDETIDLVPQKFTDDEKKPQKTSQIMSHETNEPEAVNSLAVDENVFSKDVTREDSTDSEIQTLKEEKKSLKADVEKTHLEERAGRDSDNDSLATLKGQDDEIQDETTIDENVVQETGHVGTLEVTEHAPKVVSAKSADDNKRVSSTTQSRELTPENMIDSEITVLKKQKEAPAATVNLKDDEDTAKQISDQSSGRLTVPSETEPVTAAPRTNEDINNAEENEESELKDAILSKKGVHTDLDKSHEPLMEEEEQTPGITRSGIEDTANDIHTDVSSGKKITSTEILVHSGKESLEVKEEMIEKIDRNEGDDAATLRESESLDLEKGNKDVSLIDRKDEEVVETSFKQAEEIYQSSVEKAVGDTENETKTGSVDEKVTSATIKDRKNTDADGNKEDASRLFEIKDRNTDFGTEEGPTEKSETEAEMKKHSEKITLDSLENNSAAVNSMQKEGKEQVDMDDSRGLVEKEEEASNDQRVVENISKSTSAQKITNRLEREADTPINEDVDHKISKQKEDSIITGSEEPIKSDASGESRGVITSDKISTATVDDIETSFLDEKKALVSSESIVGPHEKETDSKLHKSKHVDDNGLQQPVITSTGRESGGKVQPSEKAQPAEESDATTIAAMYVELPNTIVSEESDTETEEEETELEETIETGGGNKKRARKTKSVGPEEDDEEDDDDDDSGIENDNLISDEDENDDDRESLEIEHQTRDEELLSTANEKHVEIKTSNKEVVEKKITSENTRKGTTGTKDIDERKEDYKNEKHEDTESDLTVIKAEENLKVSDEKNLSKKIRENANDIKSVEESDKDLEVSNGASLATNNNVEDSELKPAQDTEKNDITKTKITQRSTNVELESRIKEKDLKKTLDESGEVDVKRLDEDKEANSKIEKQIENDGRQTRSNEFKKNEQMSTGTENETEPHPVATMRIEDNKDEDITMQNFHEDVHIEDSHMEQEDFKDATLKGKEIEAKSAKRNSELVGKDLNIEHTKSAEKSSSGELDSAQGDIENVNHDTSGAERAGEEEDRESKTRSEDKSSKTNSEILDEENSAVETTDVKEVTKNLATSGENLVEHTEVEKTEIKKETERDLVKMEHSEDATHTDALDEEKNEHEGKNSDLSVEGDTASIKTSKIQISEEEDPNVPKSLSVDGEPRDENEKFVKDAATEETTHGENLKLAEVATPKGMEVDEEAIEGKRVTERSDPQHEENVMSSEGIHAERNENGENIKFSEAANSKETEVEEDKVEEKNIIEMKSIKKGETHEENVKSSEIGNPKENKVEVDGHEDEDVKTENSERKETHEVHVKSSEGIHAEENEDEENLKLAEVAKSKAKKVEEDEVEHIETKNIERKEAHEENMKVSEVANPKENKVEVDGNEDEEVKTVNTERSETRESFEGTHAEENEDEENSKIAEVANSKAKEVEEVEVEHIETKNIERKEAHEENMKGFDKANDERDNVLEDEVVEREVKVENIEKSTENVENVKSSTKETKNEDNVKVSQVGDYEGARVVKEKVKEEQVKIKNAGRSEADEENIQLTEVTNGEGSKVEEDVVEEKEKHVKMKNAEEIAANENKVNPEGTEVQKDELIEEQVEIQNTDKSETNEASVKSSEVAEAEGTKNERSMEDSEVSHSEKIEVMKDEEIEIGNTERSKPNEENVKSSKGANTEETKDERNMEVSEVSDSEKIKVVKGEVGDERMEIENTERNMANEENVKSSKGANTEETKDERNMEVSEVSDLEKIKVVEGEVEEKHVEIKNTERREAHEENLNFSEVSKPEGTKFQKDDVEEKQVKIKNTEKNEANKDIVKSSDDTNTEGTEDESIKSSDVVHPREIEIEENQVTEEQVKSENREENKENTKLSGGVNTDGTEDKENLKLPLAEGNKGEEENVKEQIDMRNTADSTHSEGLIAEREEVREEIVDVSTMKAASKEQNESTNMEPKLPDEEDKHAEAVSNVNRELTNSVETTHVQESESNVENIKNSTPEPSKIQHEEAAAMTDAEKGVLNKDNDSTSDAGAASLQPNSQPENGALQSEKAEHTSAAETIGEQGLEKDVTPLDQVIAESDNNLPSENVVCPMPKTDKAATSAETGEKPRKVSGVKKFLGHFGIKFKKP